MSEDYFHPALRRGQPTAIEIAFDAVFDNFADALQDYLDHGHHLAKLGTDRSHNELLGGAERLRDQIAEASQIAIDGGTPDISELCIDVVLFCGRLNTVPKRLGRGSIESEIGELGDSAKPILMFAEHMIP